VNSIQWRRKLGSVLAYLESLTSRVESATLVEGVLAIMSSKGYYEQKGTTWLDRAAPTPSRVTTSLKLG
jgi:hypothetical protein